MRILHIITSLRSGGAERLVVDLLPRFRAHGHEVELLLFDGTRTPLLESIEAEGIPASALGTGAFHMHDPLSLPRLKRFLRRRRFDIIHTHNTPCQLLAALASPEDGTVLVTTEHNTFNRRRDWRWFRSMDRWMYGRYTFIACVGEQTRINLLDVLGESFEDKTAVIANGIDFSRFAPARSVRYDKSARDGKHIILMVAAFRPQKDHSTLLKAMAQLPEEYELWLAGEGETLAACEKLARSLSLGGRVRFLGARADVPELVAQAEVLVLSSHYEGMSLSSIEGMASGRPFIASDVEGLRDVVGGAGLLVPHEDANALAGSIRRVCEDAALYSSVLEACLSRAAGFDIDSTARAYEKVYEFVR